ncbi:YigZ family protein [Pedobacter sp. HMWF019]|uniref:IMPACT family protein n=1 Tax=Pedobacter sp. HMWF019 TaxID=2056856 RepID=UPI000D34FB74|nr:YigZ family protein [Pedobacter sp. HMWF019]PTT03600.1 YigZ family protein [Pedobacter sp. HMWF019]
MLFEDTYNTIEQPSEGLFKDKGSKFIGYAYPISSEDEVKSILLNLRSEHAKARHFCWALRLSPDRSVFRLNDDGEPSGTAGRPILNTLLSADLTNLLVVVVRYFGGTLLGVPGLINAYKNATIDALDHAVKVQKTVNDIYRITFEYLSMNDVMKVIKDEDLTVKQQSFDTSCSMDIEIRKLKLNKVIDRLESIESVKTTYLSTI